ncbi:MAG: EAL domain-containing protein [Hydrogenovibrio sp.]|uniref:bifunctional diguanylate cyclase/phosphodiesterase n=1 Tax=Hydrogenovibrio sp. TaxID=2065821 RepID=UPI00287008E1|nr:EAL domain-containing protein [Hydrogenovibrio sp.]MDR9498131.1 EAL domain-containing protein [Hydrogenovibrio sp.]
MRWLTTAQFNFLWLFLLLISIWLGGMSFLNHQSDQQKQQYIDKKLSDLTLAWRSVQHLQKKSKRAFLNTYIMQPDVLALLHQAQDPAKRDQARKRLERKMNPVYAQLKASNIYQFQFTLPDNTSLLRMHRPDFYGDDLSGLRDSFRIANETLKPVSGFGLGRVLPGFRNVFPIIDEGEHLGAVEFSHAFEALRQDMAFIDPSREYSLILHPRVKHALFQHFKNYYTQSRFNPDWIETDTSKDLPNSPPRASSFSDRSGQILSQMPVVTKNMRQGDSFAIGYQLNGQPYLASFLSIRDLENKPAAYMIALAEAPFLGQLDERLSASLIFITLLVVLLGAAIHLINQSRQDLKIAATAFNVQEGIVITDPDGHILKVNQSFTRLTGYAPHEVIGKTPAVLSSGQQSSKFYETMWRDLKKQGRWQGEIWNRRKNGEVYAEYLTITAVYNDQGKISHYIGAFVDITQRKEDEEQIRKLAFYDPLTGLPNRRLMIERLEHAIVMSERHHTYGAVLFIDLDNFKHLNDTRGHDVGDQLLIEVSERLKDVSRDADTIVRLGGDEFVVICEAMSNDERLAARDAEKIAEKIRESLTRPYHLDGIEHYNSPSIGIALFRDGLNDLDELLKQADNAMYQAKNAGRNTIRLFNPAMQKELEDRLLLEKDLRQALENDELQLHFQPQVDQQGHLLGAEALIRWQHPQRGMVSPVDFIPLAEESHLIIQIGHWVLQQACEMLCAWQKTPVLSHLTLSVNVSGRQIRQQNFVREVLDIVHHYQIPPERLKLEITESVALDNMLDTLEKMQALREAGIIFSMDDFGTGYSSLSSIKQLPISQVKIDKSFITDLESNQNDKVLTETIIAMGRALKLEVLAEGVETEAQKDKLIRLGCFHYQGYYFSRPLDRKAFDHYLLQTQQTGQV